MAAGSPTCGAEDALRTGGSVARLAKAADTYNVRLSADAPATSGLLAPCAERTWTNGMLKQLSPQVLVS